MSRISLNTNVLSLNSQRRLSDHTKNLRNSFDRLSSGLRITKASDDAAGLAIFESLDTDARVYNQGIRNINDGISLVSIADGAISELTNIVTRMTELAEQAANGALGNVQRKSLDKEAQALKAEYLRISQSTEFNGRQLLSGDFGELRLQAGYGSDGGIQSGLGGKVGTGSFSARTSIQTWNGPHSVSTGDFNGDGALDFVTADLNSDTVSVLLGDGTGSFSARTSFQTGSLPRSVSAGDFNGDGVLDLVTADFSGGTASVFLGNGTGSFSARTSFRTATFNNFSVSVSTGDFNGDGILDFVTAEQSADTVNIFIGNGTGSFSARTTFQTGDRPRSVSAGDFNGDGILDLVTADENSNTLSVLLGNGTGSFAAKTSFQTGSRPTSVSTGDFNGDGVLDLVATDEGSDTVSVLLGDGTGSFSARTSFQTGTDPTAVNTGDFNGDGILDLVYADYNGGTTSILLGDGTGSFAARTSFYTGNQPISISTGDFNGDGVLDLVTANATNNNASIFLGSTTSGTAPILDFSLETMADARQALPLLKQKLNHLTSQRGEIGAFESRLSTARNVLQVSAQNFAAARSQITDVDVATEAATLTSTQILQQAASAILAQANLQPQIALQLLGRV